MDKLTTADQGVLDKFDREFGRYLDTIKRAQQFKLGDFLVLKVSRYGGPYIIKTNTYGAPIKYKVVHIDRHSISYVKRVNKNGEPIGPISTCVGMKEDEYFENNLNFEFALDPDFADAILLQDEYDPQTLHRSKKDIWKAVTEHNKACKITSHNLADIINFFSAVNVGDTLWTSNISSFLVQDKKTADPSTFNQRVRWRQMTKVKGPFVTVLTVRNKNGKVFDITPDFFWQKALYKERPRSYKELNI